MPNFNPGDIVLCIEESFNPVFIGKIGEFYRVVRDGGVMTMWVEGCEKGLSKRRFQLVTGLVAGGVLMRMVRSNGPTINVRVSDPGNVDLVKKELGLSEYELVSSTPSLLNLLRGDKHHLTLLRLE